MLPETILAMVPAELAVAVLMIFILSAIFLHSKKNGIKNPPGPRAWPIIGNLHNIGKLPHRSLDALAKKHGPIMYLKLGQVPTIVASSPEVAEQILKTNDAVFLGRPKFQASEFMFYGGEKGVAFVPYGSHWRNMRKLCTMHLLSQPKVDMFEPLRSEELGHLLKLLEKAAASTQVVDLSDLLGKLMANIAYKMILGSDVEDTSLDLKGVVRASMDLAGAFNLSDYLPWLSRFDLQVCMYEFNHFHNYN